MMRTWGPRNMDGVQIRNKREQDKNWIESLTMGTMNEDGGNSVKKLYLEKTSKAGDI